MNYIPQGSMDPAEYATLLCEHIDAGIFSGDMLSTCDLAEFKNYLRRWQKAVEEKEINDAVEAAEAMAEDSTRGL